MIPKKKIGHNQKGTTLEPLGEVSRARLMIMVLGRYLGFGYLDPKGLLSKNRQTGVRRSPGDRSSYWDPRSVGSV